MNQNEPRDHSLKLNRVLKELLERHDLSTVQLARRTKVPKNTLFNWLAGMKPKDIEQVKKVADFFKVSLDHLLFGPGHNTRFGVTDIDSIENELNAGVFEVILRRVPSKKEDQGC